MLRLSLLVGAIGYACLATSAQQPEPSASLEDRVDAVFARWDSTTSPGCAVSVHQDGTVVYQQAYGMANLDHDVPIRTDTVFHVASLSKQFTAAAIALLVLDGELALDDPIGDHLPWVPDVGHPIAIRHLVHHNSGLRDQWALLGMAGWRYSQDRITNDDVRYLIERQRALNFRPGDRFLYSNTGYTLMGQIVERVSGQSLREFTAARIFAPLGMHRTRFRDDFSEIVKGQAFGYRRNDDTAAFHTSVTNFDTVGATSLLTTVEDMALWDRNFVDPVVGGQAFLDLMHERGTLNSGTEQDYAFGLIHGTYRGLRTVGHGGSDAGYRAHFLRFPDRRAGVVVLCNLAQTNPGRLARDVADIYLQPHLEPRAVETAAARQVAALTEAQIARVQGAYWSDELATVLRVHRQAAGLQLRVGAQPPLEMIHAGDGRFDVPDLGMGRTIRFAPAAGAVERLLSWTLNADRDPEAAQKLGPPATDRASLQELVGAYTSPELPVTYYIDLRRGTPVIHWLKRRPSELVPVAEDLLLGDSVGSLRFRRDETGQITGFTIDSGRVRRVRFDRVR